MMNIQNLPYSLTHLSSMDLIEENTQLRDQMDRLLRFGHENQQILSRNHEMSLKLIAADTLTDLIRHIFVTMKNTAQLDVISTILLDPKDELGELVSFLGIDTSKHPLLMLAQNMESFHPSLSSLHKPLLGSYCPQQHRGLFTAVSRPPRSVAVIPFRRHHRLTGFVCLGSMDINRFISGMATDFLQLQGSIMAICLDNVITQEKLKQVSLTDPLTAIGNRRHLEEQLLKELSLARRHDSALSCLFIDIDKFKLINDRLGHPAGDEVLKELAIRIKNELRSYDIPARFGGEEFVLVLPNTESHDAKTIAERIRLAAAGKAFSLPDKEFCDVTISIGGFTVTGIEPGQSLSDLAYFILSQADLALYEAKESGRNRVVWANQAHPFPGNAEMNEG
ncbi:sensor domain-containing diguanylate cyclase [Oxalobacter vibrioformis]|uniref:diguanylate cyclase n=1 Tax=Oxalobacter vibrioformis TaxID=933080 RepID=A0A9E9LV29_9BURK|nr:DUF484 family protein [Oxalobacter vibrioformis]WAW09257.1 sensor domain-containing diguanylate cyclase [Oxalobacter vibrioformis]